MSNTTKFTTMLASLILVPTSVFAQDPTWFLSISGNGNFLVSKVVPLLVAIALLVFIWGIVIFIAKSGSPDAVEEGKKKMVWGVVALFVIVSVWGLVALLQQLSGVRQQPVERPGFIVNEGGPSGGGAPSGGGLPPVGGAPGGGSPGGGAPGLPSGPGGLPSF